MTQVKKKEVSQEPKTEKEPVIKNEADLSPDEDTPKGIKGIANGIDGKGIIITAIVALVAAFILTSFITPFTPFGTYKTRVGLFETELGGIHTEVKAIQDGFTAQDVKTANSVNTVNSAIAGISNTVNTQINNQLGTYVKQTDLVSINSRLSTIETKTEAGIIKDTSVEQQLVIANTNIKKLQDTIGAIDLKTLQDRITTNEATIKNLQAKINLSNISISSSENITLDNTDRILNATITNNGDSTASFTLVLTLTSSTVTSVTGMSVTGVTPVPVVSYSPTPPVITISIPISLTAKGNLNSTLFISPIIKIASLPVSNNWTVAWSKN